MNRKWLIGFTLCMFILGLTLLHAQSQPQPAPPTPEQGQSVSGDEPFFIQFDEPVPPPDPASADFVYFYGPGPGAGVDMAFAGPVTAPLPFPPPDPQGGPGRGVAFVGPDPQDNITFVGFEAGLGNQVVTGAPYCAQITSEFTQTLSDGNKVERKGVTNVCRDGQGRTWRQQTLPAIGQYSASTNPPQVIFINDPVAGVSYVLDPVKKIARKMIRPNFQGGPAGPGRGGPGRGPGGPGGNPPNGTAGPNGPQQGNGPRRNNDVTTESLTPQSINGIPVQGTLVTRTIPAGKIGNQSPIQVTSERWYSTQLKLNLLVKNNDPQHGQNTTTVSNINTNEPDPSLFQVPADYTVQDPPKGRPRIPRGGTPPPPPAPQQ